jgi:N12 class adenine-specific DNA methylase
MSAFCRCPKVTDELDDGRRVVNHQETLAAQEKAEALQRKFTEWLWNDADRAERLAHFYNNTFNAVRPREYDGSHLSLPGSNPAFTLRPHQKAAVWRILQERAVGLFHEVGAGKTTAMAAAAMELRRLGLANKVLATRARQVCRASAGARRLRVERVRPPPENRALAHAPPAPQLWLAPHRAVDAAWRCGREDTQPRFRASESPLQARL